MPVHERHGALLGAVTHVDGTARVQTCRGRRTPLLGADRGVRRATGVPILLNTSFNNNAEPIVNTPVDALNTYLSSGLDDLVIGDYLVQRTYAVRDAAILDVLVPRLAHRYALMRAPARDGELSAFIQDRYTHEHVPISADAWRWLTAAIDRRASFGAMRDRMGEDATLTSDVRLELYDLWCRRVFVCAEAAGAATDVADAMSHARVGA